jgi:hypothetical protein
VLQVFAADGAWDRPRAPPGWFLHRPLGDVEVEGPDLAELAAPVGAWGARLVDLAVGAGCAGGLGQDPLFPGGGDLGREVERVDPGMVDFQVAPEQAAQSEGQGAQRGVVERWLALQQIGGEQVTDRIAGDGVPVQELGGAQLALRGEGSQRRRGVLPEDAHGVQEPVETQAPVLASRIAVEQDGELKAVAHGDLADRPALGRHDGRRPAQGCGCHGPPGWRCLAAGGEFGEPPRVACSSQVGDQVLRCTGRQ